MPGWYVHLEAAHDTARNLRDGTVPLLRLGGRLAKDAIKRT